MFSSSIFPVSTFPQSIFPVSISRGDLDDEEDLVVAPGTSGHGGVYGGLVVPQPGMRRRKEEPELDYQHDRDVQDLIDILSIMAKANIL